MITDGEEREALRKGRAAQLARSAVLLVGLLAIMTAVLPQLFREPCFAAEWTELSAAELQMLPMDAVKTIETDGSGGTDERASLHLVAVNIPETESERGSLEVSLRVSKGSCFKTAGILLEYDYSKLNPICWDTEQTKTAVPDIAADEPEAWRMARVVPAKCPAGISAKPALSFRRGDKGYLYMAAEQTKPQRVSEDTFVVTVRFAYGEGAVPSKDYVASALNFAESRASMADAYDSPVRGSVVYQSEDPAGGNAQVYYHKALERTAGGAVRENTNVPASQRLDSTINLFTYVPDGTSAAGSGDADNVVSIVFCDWDGTLLGSRTVVRGKGLIDPNLPENRQDYVNPDGTPRYTDEELARLGAAPLAPEGNLLTGGTDQSGKPVTTVNKQGYVYAGWAAYDGSSTPDVPLSDRNHARADGLISLEGIADNLVVRAAYHEGDEIGTKGNSSRYYTISFSPFRANDTGTFLESVVTVARTPNARRIVGEKNLLLTLRPKGAGDSVISVPLGQGDVETYTLSMQKNAAETYSEGDAITLALWDKAGIARGNEITIPAAQIAAGTR